jgi:hypothetical protein
MFTVATCPLCDERFRVQPWPMPNVLRHSRVVFQLPCGHRKFSLLAVELDLFKSGPEWFVKMAGVAEIRPPDPRIDVTKYNRKPRPTVQFE